MAIYYTKASPGSDNPISETQSIKKILQVARGHLQYMNFAQYDNPKMREGNTVKWWSIGDIEVYTGDLVTSTALAGRGASAAVTPQTATMTRKGNDIQVDEEFDIASVIDLPEELIERIGSNAGETLDTITQTVALAGATNVYYAGAVATSALLTSATVITYTDLMKVVAKLENAKAPKYMHPKFGPVYVAIGGPGFKAQLLLDTTLQGLARSQGDADRFFQNEFLVIGGIAFCLSEKATTTTGNGAATNLTADVTLVVGRGAYGVASLPLMGSGEKKIYEPTAYSSDSKYWSDSAVKQAFQVVITKPGNGAGGGIAGDIYAIQTSIAWKSMFVCKVLNASFMWKILSTRGWSLS